MNSSNRKTATIVGVLYIIGTAAGILSVVFTSSILNAPDFLNQIAANTNQFLGGALFVLLMGFALAMVPVLLFPIFKKQNEALAVGYVVFRGALEMVTYIVTVVVWLFLVVVSREAVTAGGAAGSALQSLGAVLQKVDTSILTVFAFSLGALMIYTLFYQSNLFPRWISIWGFVAILLHLTTGFLLLLGLSGSNSTLNTVMNFPIFIQEMVMAVWLIVKGFNPAAMAGLSAKTK